MQTAGRVQSLGEQQANVLQVSLAPALVALGEPENRRRALFIASVQVVGDADFPTGAAHEGGFDEVVAQNLAAEGTFSRKDRQLAVLHERLDANDRVVSVVVAVALRPMHETFEENR